MNYIIDPMWFYWINVADALDAFISIISVLFGFGVLVMFIYKMIATWMGKGYDENDPDNRMARVLTKPLIIGCILSVFFIAASVFVPDKNTLIEMQVAKLATYENAEWTLDTIKSAVDYIVEAIGSIS